MWSLLLAASAALNYELHRKFRLDYLGQSVVFVLKEYELIAAYEVDEVGVGKSLRESFGSQVEMHKGVSPFCFPFFLNHVFLLNNNPPEINPPP